MKSKNLIITSYTIKFSVGLGAIKYTIEYVSIQLLPIYTCLKKPLKVTNKKTPYKIFVCFPKK